jgi:hypothetical protein
LKLSFTWRTVVDGFGQRELSPTGHRDLALSSNNRANDQTYDNTVVRSADRRLLPAGGRFVVVR